MRYEIQFTDHALADYLDLTARWRAMAKEAIEIHLRYEPHRESKSRISRRMARNLWETSELMTIPLEEAEDRLAYFVNEAAKQQVVITNAGRPVAVLIGFADEDEWFEYHLLQDPRFKQRIIEARTQAKVGQLTRIEDLPA